MAEPTRNSTVRLIEVYNQLMAMKAIGKRRRKAKTRWDKHGTLGGPAPTLAEDRIAAYQVQNGTNRLTPAQHRRVKHKAGHALRAGHLTI